MTNFTINVDSAATILPLYAVSGGVNTIPTVLNLTGTTANLIYISFTGDPNPSDPNVTTLLIPSTITMSQRGIYQIKYIAEDMVGNRSVVKTIIVNVDMAFEVFSISPMIVGQNGGDLLIIKGQSFSNDVDVLIDGDVIPSNPGGDSGTIIARTMAHEVAICDIEVRDIVQGVSQVFQNSFSFVKIIMDIADPIMGNGEIKNYIFDSDCGAMTLKYENFDDFDIDKVIELRVKNTMTNLALLLKFGKYPKDTQRGF